MGSEDSDQQANLHLYSLVFLKVFICPEHSYLNGFCYFKQGELLVGFIGDFFWGKNRNSHYNRTSKRTYGPLFG